MSSDCIDYRTCSRQQGLQQRGGCAIDFEVPGPKDQVLGAACLGQLVDQAHALIRDENFLSARIGEECAHMLRQRIQRRSLRTALDCQLRGPSGKRAGAVRESRAR